MLSVCAGSLFFQQVFQAGKGIVRGVWQVLMSGWSPGLVSGFKLSLVFVVVAVNAQQFPVTAIGGVVIVIVITVMNGKLLHRGAGKFSLAATADPRIHF